MILEYKAKNVTVALRDPIDVDSVEDVSRWMREYWKDQSGDHKFAFMIGFYQISQALEWKVNLMESNTEWASCVLHVIGACEVLGGDIAKWTPSSFIQYQFLTSPNYPNILQLASMVCQMHIYHDESGPRRERFKIDVLTRTTAELAAECLYPIKPKERAVAIERALAQLVNVEYMK